MLERAEGGLGLGLALVRGLIALHGGTVSATSEGLGSGSEFIVRLPESAPMAETPSSDVTDDSGLEVSLRVMVVDDNRDAADACSGMLQLSGHTVRTAYLAGEAFELAAAFKPHAMLIDIGLPDLNGYELAKRIREAPWGRGVLLVAATGWGQSNDRKRALASGFDHHLTKPVAAEAIEAALQIAQNGLCQQTSAAR